VGEIETLGPLIQHFGEPDGAKGRHEERDAPSNSIQEREKIGIGSQKSLLFIWRDGPDNPKRHSAEWDEYVAGGGVSRENEGRVRAHLASIFQYRVLGWSGGSLTTDFADGTAG
jgi:hypothetical protein